MIQDKIRELVQYGLLTGLVSAEDEIYTTNRLLELFQIEDYPYGFGEKIEQTEEEAVKRLPDLLTEMMDYAVENGIMQEDGIVYRDLFDTKIMSCLVGRPSEIIRRFHEEYEKSPEAATDFFYKFSQDTDYIRRYRVCRDEKWVTPTKYGDLDITINLSKPEKDPKAIAAARLAKQGGYPKCLLCVENEGYAGRINHPARQNHRIIPLTINGSRWGFQYSPYVYYNEHCIVFNGQHTPMKIEHNTFVKLFDFVKQFPHYILGSNADLPIVGGSILSHDHFQGGRYEFPMAKAPVEKSFTVKGFEDVQAGIVNWPMSVIRISGPDTERLIALADVILDAWRSYSDEASFIFAETEGEKHNTITPIARKRGDHYELDLVLMNGADVKGGMQAQELFSEELLIAVPQLSPLNEKAVWAEGSRYRYLDLKWLNGQNVILPYPGQSLRADVEAVLKSEGITLGRIETIRNIEMAMQMVAEGLGIGFNREYYAMNMKYRKRVNYYTMGATAPKTAFVAGYRKDIHVTEPMQRFIALCRQQAYTEWESLAQ
mgnify:CR=1 FL=1